MRVADARALRQLIALCTRSDEADLPAKDAEWNALLPLALAHGVGPLLFAKLRERVLPVRARDHLRLVYLSNSFRNEKLLTEQQRIREALSRKSLTVWPLKGPQLSQVLYGDPAIRQVADMDFLIQPKDLAACDGVLQSLGYARQVRGEIALLHDAGELVYLRSVADANESMNFAVDLQQRVLPYGRRDPLADRIRSQGGTPENQLLLLCTNQVAHRFARLKYLLDVAACLRALPQNFNWQDFTTAVRLLDFTPGIYWSLAAARAVASAPVPEDVLLQLSPSRTLRKLAALALGEDAHAPLLRGDALDGPAGAWAILACTRGGAQIRVAWSLLFPPAAYMRQEFSAPADAATLPLYLRRLGKKLPAAFRSLR